MEGAQVHWQTGQGDKDGGGGEGGLGLGQQDPEGDVGGRTEAGREPSPSRAAEEECGGAVVGAGEAGGDCEADVTEVREEDMSGGEAEAKGEVMRGMGEGGCGEKERAGRWRGSAGKRGWSELGRRASNSAGGAKSSSKMDDS